MKRLPFPPGVLALMFGVLLIATPGTAIAQVVAPPNGITVTGFGTAAAPAETATVVISVGFDPYMYGGGPGWAPYPAEGATPDTAADQISPGIVTASDIARPIIDALVAAGLSADEIEVLTNPYMGGYGPYGAPLNVSIRFGITDPTIEDLKALLDPAIQAAAGARIFINTISVVYGIENCAPLYQEARETAVRHARASAEQQATALDVRLGPIVASRDNAAALYSGPWFGPMPLNSCTPGVDAQKAISSFGGPIFDPDQPAEVSVQTAVEITFDITP